ncbi:hypothetical protein KR222_005407 [Zaprionus bogoriensis]|nr:hypothetical protein KR222_005407 [Zaprionus bogoriensis]
MVQSSTKFTGICIAIYLSYALFVFLVLPFLVPNPLTMSRAILAQQTRHLGSLSNYTLEAGGKPIRSMLVTFRGSGALSLLDYLSRQAGCYHHFSPLIGHRRQITETKQVSNALVELVSLYNCDYNHSLAMLNLGMRTPTFRKFYGVQSFTCTTYSNEVCWNPETMASICKIFPFINMSVYNMQLRFLKVLLELKNLDLRMLLLVRDPRGTMASRAKRVWCANNPDCSRPFELCKNMVSDYEIATKLLQDYPNRFGIVRFEELAENPTKELKTIFNFYGLPMKPLDVNADRSRKSESDAKPESQDDLLYFDGPLDWMSTLTAEQVRDIQTTCQEAMRLWGYNALTDTEIGRPGNFVQLEKLPLFLH